MTGSICSEADQIYGLWVRVVVVLDERSLVLGQAERGRVVVHVQQRQHHLHPRLHTKTQVRIDAPRPQSKGHWTVTLTGTQRTFVGFIQTFLARTACVISVSHSRLLCSCVTIGRSSSNLLFSVACVLGDHHELNFLIFLSIEERRIRSDRNSALLCEKRAVLLKRIHGRLIVSTETNT